MHPLAGQETTVADEAPASKNRIDKPDSNGSGTVAGVAGTSENGKVNVSVADSDGLTTEEVQRIKRLVSEGMKPKLAREAVLRKRDVLGGGA